jgi:hypothetical protein
MHYGQVCIDCSHKYLDKNFVVKGPLQLVIALVLLYGQMQLAILPGVLLLLVMIPINLFLKRISIELESTNDRQRSTNQDDE